MTIHCSFHPSKAAHFQCNRCNSAFCGQCITRRGHGLHGDIDVVHLCPLCNIPAEHVGVGNFLEPFWTRMPKFFSYPAHPRPLLLILFMAASTALFFRFWPFHLLFFVISTKYAYEILITTAKGNLTPPAITFDLINKDVDRVFKQYVVFLLLGAGGGVIQGVLGEFGLLLYGLFITISLPAIIMLLVATDSILAAVNPMLFVSVIGRIGWRYLLLCLFLIMLPGAPAILTQYLPDMLPMAARIFLGAAFQHYYTFILYHLMGYVLLQYHEEIGYEVDYDFFLQHSLPKGEQQSLSPEERFRNIINILVKSGRNEEAITAILEKTKGEFGAEDVELSEKFLTLLKLCQRTNGVAQHAPVHLDLLVGRGKKAKAIELFEELFAGGAASLEPSAKALLAIAHWFNGRRDHRQAMSCYARFIQGNPKHPTLPEAYFALLKILHEQGGNTAKAIQLAKGLIQQYPDHSLIPEVRSYLGSMS